MTSFGWNDIDNEKEALLRSIAANTSDVGPFHAEINVTNRCNLNCFFCNQGSLNNDAEIAFTKLRAFIDDLTARGVRSVRLAGGGEPLIYRHIHELLDYLAEKEVFIDNLNTNGVRLNERLCERLARQRVRGVIISLNASNPDSYATMMRVPGGVYDKVVENVKHLVALRKESPANLPEVNLQFILYRDNVGDLRKMYELGRELGVDIIYIRMMHRMGTGVIPREEDRKLIADQMESIIRENADEINLDIDMSGFCKYRFYFLPQMTIKTKGIPRTLAEGLTCSKYENYCFYGWYSITVNGEGNVYPCCTLMQSGYPPLGNINEQSLDEIWNGPEYGRFREELVEIIQRKGKLLYDPRRHKYIRQTCIDPFCCDMKWMYFIHDSDFYRRYGQINARQRKAMSLIDRTTNLISGDIPYYSALLRRRASRVAAKLRGRS